MGGDVVDVDVSLSSDGVLVAFHDSLLRRTTGAPGRVSTTSFADLSRLDAGWGFTRSGTYPFRGRSLTVPSVEAILRRFPTTPVTLDLKDQRTLVSQPRFKADDGTRRVTPETLAFSHRMGTAVLTWIVDDPKDMAELIDLGVDGICTRRPDLLVEVLRSRRAR